MKSISADILRKSLSDAQSYRDFLKIYFEVTSLPYAEIARRSGFSSRSYPRDITEGRRRLTSRSLPTLIRGLKLEPRLGELFQLLYFGEHPEEFSAKSGTLLQRTPEEIKSHLESKIEQTRKRLHRPTTIRKNLSGTQTLSLHSRLTEDVICHLFEVLASLGNPEKGASLETIEGRTGIKSTKLSPLLKICVSEALVRYDEETQLYYPSSAHLNLTGMPKNELIRKIFLRAAERTLSAVEQRYGSDDALFYVSAISVKQSNLPKMKTELRELLLRYADSKVEESEEPDTVVYVVGSMFEARGTHRALG